jgi:hypothetical protein
MIYLSRLQALLLAVALELWPTMCAVNGLHNGHPLNRSDNAVAGLNVCEAVEQRYDIVRFSVPEY